MNDRISEVRNFISRVLNVDPSSIDSHSALGETEHWDSLKHMEIAIEFEKKFGLSLNAETIVEIASFQGMLKLLDRSLD